MKRVIYVILVILAVSTSAQAKYSGGTGEPNTPYQIATSADLNDIVNHPEDFNKCFIMTADIDLDPNLPGNKVFTTAVIAPDTNTNVYFQGIPFAGVFDGAGHKIKNMTIEANDVRTDYLGLFGDVNRGEIKNLGLENVKISVGTYSYDLGGLVGENWASISNCYSTGIITIQTIGFYVGGLVGRNHSNISNCYSTTSVSSGNYSSDLGGLVGANSGYGASISKCYSSGFVTVGSGSGGIGGLIGRIYSGSISDSYFLSGAGPNNGLGTPLTDSQMKQQASFIGWDFNSVWTINEGIDYPKLTWQKYSGGSGEPNAPYQIANVADLMTLANDANDYNKCFIITADIDLAGYTFTTAVIAPDTDNASSGFQGADFNGVFDGAGHKILNLNIDGGSNDYLGLFGNVNGGQIKNLGVENVYIARNTPYAYTHGGIIGWNNGSLSGCFSTGKLYGGYFLNSYGGLVGKNDSNGCIDNCFSDVNVLVDGWEAVGAIGGLVGDNGGNITNCYSVGPVLLHGCGLIGSNTGTVTASFWDINTSGKSTSSGGTGKTTAQMKTKSTFTDAGWDFNDVWHICESTNYPKLLWQILPADLVCPDGVNFNDYAFFAERWLDTNCASYNDCDGTDFDLSGTVDLEDLAAFVENWLVGL